MRHLPQVVLTSIHELHSLFNLHSCVCKQDLFSPFHYLVHSIQTQHSQGIDLVDHCLHQLFLHLKPFHQQSPIRVKSMVLHSFSDLHIYKLDLINTFFSGNDRLTQDLYLSLVLLQGLNLLSYHRSWELSWSTVNSLLKYFLVIFIYQLLLPQSSDLWDQIGIDLIRHTEFLLSALDHKMTFIMRTLSSLPFNH